MVVHLKVVTDPYLVVFDARKRDHGTGLNPTTIVNASTVRAVFVDVRPDAPSAS
jgi:hypothetical protein